VLVRNVGHTPSAKPLGGHRGEGGGLRAAVGRGPGLECRVAAVLPKLGFRETGRVQRDAVYGDSLLGVREFERGPAADPVGIHDLITIGSVWIRLVTTLRPSSS
jgi:hypothetical protein